MKRKGASISYSSLSSSSSNHNHHENFTLVLGRISKKIKKNTKTRCEIVQRENGRCEICAEIERKKLQNSSDVQKSEEEKRHEVVVIIDENKEQKNDTLEEKMEGNIVEEEKIVIMDDGVDVETLLDEVDKNDPLEGGERNEEKNDEDLFSFDVIGESDFLLGWDEWKYEE